MSEDQKIQIGPHLDYTSAIVSAYLSANVLPVSEVPAFIAAVHAKIGDLASGVALPSVPTETAFDQPTALQIKRSITPDHLISFVDGKPYKTLKRHLGMHGLDPHSYRQRYGLPADYPMTSPNYSVARSALAKQAGLGLKAAA